MIAFVTTAAALAACRSDDPSPAAARDYQAPASAAQLPPAQPAEASGPPTVLAKPTR